MGRKIMRVPLDFTAQLNQPWAGNEPPNNLVGNTCPDCTGGLTGAGMWLAWVCIQLSVIAGDVGDQQRGRAMHPWLEQASHGYQTMKSEDRTVRPSPEIAELVANLADTTTARITDPFSGSHKYDIYRSIVAAAGLDPETWGSCTSCHGTAKIEQWAGQRAAADAWEPTPPPHGDGWQLWQTTSDGPMSPVFHTADELARWMVANGEASTIETANKFISIGHASSLIAIGDRVITGVEHAGGQ